jgi:acyl-CoA dehydrogenase
MVDFRRSAAVEELTERTRAFVRDVVVPAEARDSGHGLDDALRAELQAAARAAGLLAPHVAREYGGLGLDMRDRSDVFEAAGYSLLGPHALNCAAPDEGNMHLLEEVASDDQRERYLRPLAAGEVRSCFAMTEPAPGAGSDPSMLRTTAERRDGGFVIDGEKRLITGAQGAAFAICMARTDDVIDRGRGATMLLVDADNPGFRVTRAIPTIDGAFAGGHCEVVFEDCFVPEEAVLGEVGLGFRYAQVRLAPARLTHCMRWLGIAQRALDTALDLAAHREAFGERLENLGMIQALVADSVVDIESSRALLLHACWVVDNEEPGSSAARHHSSVAKVHVSEAVFRVVDRAIQICGGTGVTHDAPLGRYLAEVRPFRIYDGPSETHRWSIARRASRQRAQANAR